MVYDFILTNLVQHFKYEWDNISNFSRSVFFHHLGSGSNYFGPAELGVTRVDFVVGIMLQGSSFSALKLYFSIQKKWCEEEKYYFSIDVCPF